MEEAAATDLRTLPEVVGANVRRLREERNWTQGELARRCFHFNLPWRRPTISLVEGGARELGMGELIVLAMVLNVTLADLFAGEGMVQLVQGLSGRLPEIRTMFGQSAGDAHTEIKGLSEAIDHFLDVDYGDYLKRLSRAKYADTVARVVADARQEAEQKAAARLGVTADIVSACAHALWGRSLTEERDARVGPGTSPQARGHVTRQLIADIQSHLKGDD